MQTYWSHGAPCSTRDLIPWKWKNIMCMNEKREPNGHFSYPLGNVISIENTRAGVSDYNVTRIVFSSRCIHHNLPVTARAWGTVDGGISRNLFMRNIANSSVWSQVLLAQCSLSLLNFHDATQLNWQNSWKSRRFSIPDGPSFEAVFAGDRFVRSLRCVRVACSYPGILPISIRRVLWKLPCMVDANDYIHCGQSITACSMRLLFTFSPGHILRSKRLQFIAYIDNT